MSKDDCAPDKEFPYDRSLSRGAALRMTVLGYDLRRPDVIHDMDRCAAMAGTLSMPSLDDTDRNLDVIHEMHQRAANEIETLLSAPFACLPGKSYI